ncbi:hypothetical protein Gocc_3078 [Gaiella occulta]|uniref:PIN domain-containing protein n=1 Tax=Gaiella occulta TaxID=1002870 RepID=A0A7M2YUA2_9ACTN|nr:hypothetical protein [Gaiella occulta]RDI73199.1 hypothetical protein Gocc_3078 [Gaiella occulta]
MPIVVDADVLLRNVDYALRQGWTGALIDSASSDYTLFTGVVLFATDRVLEEVERNLPKVARRRGVGLAEAVALWNEVFLPRVRIIDFDERLVDDPRVNGVRALHANDAPTAALAVALAPCVLLTDNREHFLPLGLPDRPTDEIALDLHQLSQVVAGSNGAVMITGLTGTAVIEGSKKVISKIGKDGAILVGLVLLGLIYAFWRSDRGGRFRQVMRDMALEVGPPLLQAVETGVALTEKVSALAIEAAEEASPALSAVAQRLAVRQTTMTTSEIVTLLREEGYVFSKDGSYATFVRAWLVKGPCFHEIRRGHWTLGYHASPMDLHGADDRPALAGPRQ